MITATRRFFEPATRRIESEISAIADPGERIIPYLRGVGVKVSALSTVFAGHGGLPAAAEIYDVNSAAAPRRVRELIEDGIAQGRFRDIDARFAGHVMAPPTT